MYCGQNAHIGLKSRLHHSHVENTGFPERLEFSFFKSIFIRNEDYKVHGEFTLHPLIRLKSSHIKATCEGAALSGNKEDFQCFILLLSESRKNLCDSERVTSLVGFTTSKLTSMIISDLSDS